MRGWGPQSLIPREGQRGTRGWGSQPPGGSRGWGLQPTGRSPQRPDPGADHRPPKPRVTTLIQLRLPPMLSKRPLCSPRVVGEVTSSLVSTLSHIVCRCRMGALAPRGARGREVPPPPQSRLGVPQIPPTLSPRSSRASQSPQSSRDWPSSRELPSSPSLSLRDIEEASRGTERFQGLCWRRPLKTNLQTQCQTLVKGAMIVPLDI